ncbi:dipeptide ABC transporter ATP-binding protein [Natronorubrum sp. JWXQ-INN-674]|uniref:Dipeptide ABC transporter ATP-binding protein n=1 Tax=Natronorubrum halalkaliphilum TaxID=2691917 RepID=A0A6B0VIS0_9EURY|nr:ABC transporter ATP-binding protein [Natronorubrum halalkaliphilum]MXV60499.1 dipeptide ABC transporter ATP-binding protein [Natronorubrum halalkaliphilum]
MAAKERERAEPKPDDVIMSVEDVTVRFGMDRGESRVLDSVSMDIHRNEILGIVGESGSGKSMFADALLDAVVDPGRVDGSITYYTDDGEPVDVLDLDKESLRTFRWEHVSMVFQGAMNSFNPTMDIRGHFVETLEAHDYDVESGLEHARELLEALYLDPDRVLDSYPHELSGGMSQRALIALSLVLEPDVLVMDEPTAALDLLMQRSILSLLETVKDEYDLTIVFITHDLPLVTGLADRIAVLYAFDFVEVGTAANLFENPSHPYTRSLLKAIPTLDTPLDEIKPIEGSSPDPVSLPTGCTYHPRCSLADDRCKDEEPAFHDVPADDGHRTACFHWEDAADEIPLTSDDETDTTTEIVGEQSDEALLSLSDVEVHFEQQVGLLESFFSDPSPVRAVDGVSLDIYENDVVALVGESGCGKTTLGKTIVAAQRPTGGEITYSGQDIWDAKDGEGDIEIPYGEIRKALQIIHQDPGSSLNPNRTVMANLEVPFKQWNTEMDHNDREKRILSMLEHVGMSPPRDYAHRYPHQLSGGEQQRVALIRALSMNPGVIFADEAVSALDVSLRVEMMDLMLELQDVFDTSFLFTSHNLSNARYLSASVDGRIAVMYLGEIVEIGPGEEVISNPKHPYTKILKWSTEDIDTEGEVAESPLREIDIPDPIDPPSGCSFHTRCPDARKACTEHDPLLTHDDSSAHHAACFREYPEDHPYWDSEPLSEATDETDDSSGSALEAGD